MAHLSISSRAAVALSLALALPCACHEDLQHPSDFVADQWVEGALPIAALLPLSEGVGLSARDAVRLAAEDAGVVAEDVAFATVVADSAPSRITGVEGIDTELRRRLALLRGAGVPAVVVADGAAARVARQSGDSRGPVVLSYALSGGDSASSGRGAPTFMLGPSHDHVGRLMASVALDVGPSVAVLTLAGDPEGASLRAAVEAAVVAGGGHVVEGAWLDPLAAGGQRERVAPVLARAPAVVVPALPAGVIASVVNEAMPSTPAVAWLFPPWAVSPSLVDNLSDPAALEGSRAVAPGAGVGPMWGDFVARFVERTGRAPAPFDALAYDAVRLVAAAAGRWMDAGGSGVPSARDLARELPEVDHGGAYSRWRLRADGGADAQRPLQVFRFDATTRSFFPDSSP